MKEHVDLSRYTTIGTGGPARWFAEPETVAELSSALAWAVELRETFPAHYKSAFAPTIISGWPGRVAGVDSPGDRELKDFLSVCESDGRLKPRQITKKKRI